jgi:protein phosphatase 1L
MPIKHEAPIVERFVVSELCAVGVACFQGRQEYMEDRYSIITNINNSDVSLYAIFDGHAGAFAADYCASIIMPCVSEKIAQLIDIVRERQEKIEMLKRLEKERKKKLKKGEIVEEIDEEEMTQDDEENENPNPLLEYISEDNIINYEKLLFDEITANDKILLDRMGKAALFCGTTANIVLVDLTNKLIICANVGDSRAIMCDSKGNAFPLSEDHKPDLPAEMDRIRQNGGHISNKNGCWRVDGTLACSRTLGDYPLKMKKLIIADPDIVTFKFKEMK